MCTPALQNLQDTSLLSSGSLSDRVRVRKLSCSGKHARAWLNAIPKTHAFRLSPRHMQIALRLRLGLEQPRVPLEIKCAGCNRHVQDAQ